jgi:hypothetical protein
MTDIHTTPLPTRVERLTRALEQEAVPIGQGALEGSGQYTHWQLWLLQPTPTKAAELRLVTIDAMAGGFETWQPCTTSNDVDATILATTIRRVAR